MSGWYAKSGNLGQWWEPLRNHLTRVGERAATNAESLGAKEAALVAGLFHDLGKYSQRFLNRLHGTESGLDHWSMGAAAALKQYKHAGLPIACAILGHHVGLTSGHKKTVVSELSRLVTHPEEYPQLTEHNLDALFERFTQDGLKVPENTGTFEAAPEQFAVARMLDIRMLFSALVDADAYWSEAHREGDAVTHYRPRLDGLRLDAKAALECLQKHMSKVRSASSAAPHVNEIRDQLFTACLDAGRENRGLFTLAAPTGAGKTWGMLAFALQHAVRHPEIRRIIVVIPYLSIIEQTAKLYQRLFTPVFGDSFVIENHSLAGVGHGQPRQKVLSNTDDDQDEARQINRLLAENWDAPLVITTSVQCLESLFANRPSACRKLHNLAQSVILFDEVQTLPLNLAVPTLAALSRLVERYETSVVFATATQPAFDHLHHAVKKRCWAGWRPIEITANLDLFASVRAHPRQVVDWRLDTSFSWVKLAEELERPENDQTLCIVNLKAHARSLVELLIQHNTKGVLHLSTNMCPAHRRNVLDDVSKCLKSGAGKPCRLISTQCVEAGVDIDFPVVFRALAPLEAIAQAAGRCNRGGARPATGRLVVFVPEDERYPLGDYKQAAHATKIFLSSQNVSDRKHVLDSPHLLRHYYVNLLYPLTNAEGPDTPQAKQLNDALNELDFVKTAECYRLIRTDAVNLLVPFNRPEFDRLVEQYERQGRLNREWLVSARPFTVGLYRPNPDAIGWNCLRPLGFSNREDPDHLTTDWFYLDESLPDSIYDTKRLGLKELQDDWIA